MSATGRDEELVALVDEAGREVGSAPRSVVRRDNLLHSANGVFVRDPAGRIYVHRRADTKDWAPGHHDAAAGGVVQPGEQPVPAAERELAEELGITGVPLRPLGRFRFRDDTTNYVAYCFEVTWAGPVEHADGEVAWGDWMELPELRRRMLDPRWPFVPDTRAFLHRLGEDATGDYAALLP